MTYLKRYKTLLIPTESLPSLEKLSRASKDLGVMATQGKYRNNYSWKSKNYRRPPFNKKEGGRGCSKEPELNHDQNIEVRDRGLQVAGRLKYFLSVWVEITSDKNS